MKKRFIWSLVVLSIVIAAFLYGVGVGAYKLFPHAIMVYVKDMVQVTRNTGPAVTPIVTPRATPKELSYLDQFRVEFEGRRGGRETSTTPSLPYDIAVADMDLDGDIDLLLNWHLNDLELYENTGTGFDLRNPVFGDRSGLFEAGNVSLYGATNKLKERIAAKAEPGIYLWHDFDRFKGYWNLIVHAPDLNEQTLELIIRSNEKIEEFEGLENDEVKRVESRQQRDNAYAELSVRIDTSYRFLRFRTSAVGSNVIVENASPSAPLSNLPFYVGPELRLKGVGRISLRKSDPHGVAWLQVLDSPEPDLFVARGGNRGRLKPPFEAKRNRFFAYRGEGETTYEMVSPTKIPPDYGRGRGVAWVDIDNDGRNELFLGNQASPNALLVYNSDQQAYRDLASQFGISFYCGDAFSWFDVDHDGWQDLVFLTCYNSIAIARNIEGKRFEVMDSEDIGLTISGVDRPDRLFLDATIVILDVDLDGKLDIWVGGLGSDRQHRVFLRRGERFVDATERLGVNSVRGAQRYAFIDLENDGFPDLAVVGRDGAELFRNQSGKGFQSGFGIAALSDAKPLSAVAISDFDGDGRQDVVIAGLERWWVLSNRLENRNESVIVYLRQGHHEPVGALVRAEYESGRLAVQRYGSASSNGISQSLPPLFFGSPSGDPVVEIGILWPGSMDWQTYDVPGTNVIVGVLAAHPSVGSP